MEEKCNGLDNARVCNGGQGLSDKTLCEYCRKKWCSGDVYVVHESSDGTRNKSVMLNAGDRGNHANRNRMQGESQVEFIH
jgi:hypothetical protein